MGQLRIKSNYTESDVEDFVKAYHDLDKAGTFQSVDFTLTTFWGEAASKAGLASDRRYMLMKDGNPIGLFQGLVERKIFYKGMRAGSTSGNGIIVLRGIGESDIQFFIREVLKQERLSDIAIFAPLSIDLPNFVSKPNYTHYVNLALSMDQIFQNMDKKTRNRVRKAERDGVQVAFSDSSEDLTKAYHVIELASHEDVYSIPTWSYTERLHEYFKRQNSCSAVALCRRKDSEKVISAAHVIGFDKKLVLWQAGSTEEGYKMNAGSLAQAETIRWAKDRHYLIYDMGGTNPTERVYSGIHRFKAGFGGSLITNKLLQKQAFYVPFAARIRRALLRIPLVKAF